MAIQRIKVSELESMVDLINRLSEAGLYKLSKRANKYKLVSTINKDVLNTGYVPKRELFNALCSFRDTLVINKAVYQSLTYL